MTTTCAPPFTDRCPRCNASPFVAPLVRVARPGEIRCVYRCPRCRSSWWTGFNAAALEGYADRGVGL